MLEQRAGEWLRLLESWSLELRSTTDRLNYLIGDRQRHESGTYRESLLRRLLRRVLPERFRVSTGFIHRWPEHPSRQLDVIVWDAQEHAALLEEGELVVLAPEAVAAIIEVKTTLDARELTKGLELLYPVGTHAWRFAQSTTGLKQQVPDLPYRAVFAYSDDAAGPEGTVRRAFERVAEFLRDRFGEEAKQALMHTGLGSVHFPNLLSSICVAGRAHIEQTNTTIECDNGKTYSGPALVAFASPPGVNVAVGRFCMSLQAHLAAWPANKTARETLNAPMETTNPGLAYFGRLPGQATRVHSWGIEVNSTHVWHPEKPLWVET